MARWREHFDELLNKQTKNTEEEHIYRSELIEESLTTEN